ncbi:MAG: hypothetical protein IT365_29705 [Candidatus Hydrogenedentes bacterium]|nr:hypothetical protein [Candidatus Hydrogenedentota bacterium]
MTRKFFELWPRSGSYWSLVFMTVLLVILPKITGEPRHIADGENAIFVLTAVVTITFGYAYHRVFNYHPATLPGYRDWLLMTPYDSSQPLPLGPVLLDWRDLLFVVPFTPLTFTNSAFPWYSTLLGFVFAYLLAFVFVFMKVGRPVVAWAAMMGLAAPIALLDRPWLALIVLTGLFLALFRFITDSYRPDALRKGIPRTPQGAVRRTEKTSGGSVTTKETEDFLYRLTYSPEAENNSISHRESKFGWPLAVLGPWTPIAPLQSRRAALAVSILIVTWVLASAHHVETLVNFDGGIYFHGAVAVVTAAAGIWRLLKYNCWRLQSPLSIMGRLLTRRTVIPGYDHVFVIPIATALLGALLPFGFALLGLSPYWSFVLTIGVCTYIVFAGRPSLRQWTLIGQYRLAGLTCSTRADSDGHVPTDIADGDSTR